MFSARSLLLHGHFGFLTDSFFDWSTNQTVVVQWRKHLAQVCEILPDTMCFDSAQVDLFSL